MTSWRALDLSTGTPLMAVRQSPSSTRPVDSSIPLRPLGPRGKALMKIWLGGVSGSVVRRVRCGRHRRGERGAEGMLQRAVAIQMV